MCYGGCSLPEAYTVTDADARAFFASRTFKDWQKAKEGEGKIQVGIANRLNEIIKALSGRR